MANPKRKISRTRRDKRRSHHALQTPGKSLCTSCFEPKPPHQVRAATSVAPTTLFRPPVRACAPRASNRSRPIRSARTVAATRVARSSESRNSTENLWLGITGPAG